MVLPVLFENQVKAVIELASFQKFSDIHLTFLDQLTESIGIVLNTITATMRTEELLKQSQTLATELQTRQEELTQTNQRLQEQARTLQSSEERLRQQQEELQQTNEELEEKAELLSKQNMEVERKNREIQTAKLSLEEKAQQLAITSKYKSEFLANMSHELRTPLNSLLILSQLLSQNASGNLSSKQVEYATTIHSSGADLLALINEILDLTKIESGAMDVDVTEVRFTSIEDYVERNFRQVAQDRSLDFEIVIDGNLPNSMLTDLKRLHQVLRNLLSNAFKFTQQGKVTFTIANAIGGWSSSHSVLNAARNVVQFAVSDTGIGISADKHRVIFEAFQQADGTTSRRFGGTGLGLSISREIANLLGGEVRLTASAPGLGSTFTLFLPITFSSQTVESQSRVTQDQLPLITLEPADISMQWEIEDDRQSIEPGDRVLLIVEDDLNFAKILLDKAHEREFKALVARRGENALAMAREFRPDAITLDLGLPDVDGWTVLDRLKNDLATRHIPIHIISASDGRQRGLKLGAVSYLQKPVTEEALSEALSGIRQFIERGVRNLLVVEDDETQRNSIVELIGNGDVSTEAVGTGEQALALLKESHFDCLVLDLGLPDMTGFELIERIKSEAGLQELPIIIYTGKELSKSDETELRRMAETIIIKDVQSPERLLDETALFLHRVEVNLPEAKRRVLHQLHQTDAVLAGKKALIVDDDVRNIFALTSALENVQMEVSYAENGRDALSMLENTAEYRCRPHGCHDA